VELCVVLPYARGDLLARAHREGEVLSVDHTGGGTVLTARVSPDLAYELDRFVVAGGPAAEPSAGSAAGSAASA
jgi:GTP-binding protein HflX